MAHQRYLDVLAELEFGINQLVTSQLWQDFLKMQSTFHCYSYRNALLILRQCPHASQVAGFRSWRSLGRSVRRGERAIWILAPWGVEDDRRDRSARPAHGFVPVPVFDVSQTSGQPLPEVCRRLTAPDGAAAFAGLLGVAGRLGFMVELADLAGGVNGECSVSSRLIRIEQRNSTAQTVKSLAHELVHAILHREVPDRPRAELEAESAAYVICRQLGIESDDYSFGYVASWAGGAELASAAIHQSCERIASAVEAVLSLYEPGAPVSRIAASDRPLARSGGGERSIPGSPAPLRS